MFAYLENNMNVKTYDIIELQAVPAEIRRSIYKYYPIYTTVEGRTMATGIYAHVSQLSILRAFPQYVPKSIFEDELALASFNVNKFLRIQLLKEIWKIDVVKAPHT